MAVRQIILSGPSGPVYVNETGTRQEVLSVVFDNETVTTTTPNVVSAQMAGTHTGRRVTVVGY
jgi:hypothetical protein